MFEPLREMEEDDWEDEEDEPEDAQLRGIAGRKGMADELPDGWACIVKRGVDGRYLVQYVSQAKKAGECIRSKGQLRSYLEKRGFAPSVVDEKVQKAEFSQTFARRFILLNSADCPDDGDTSRDELIALAMQESFDQELRLGGSGGGDEDDDGNDPDFNSDGESLGSQDSDDIGDVAAGGWRQRQSEQEQETAEDYDISCLEVKTLTTAEDGCCAVCQSDWEAGDEMRILPCDHKFHTSCIDQWLRKHKASCPLCKKDVREDWEDMGEEVWDPVSGTWKSAQQPAPDDSSGAG